MFVFFSKLLIVRVMHVHTQMFQIDVTTKEARAPAKAFLHHDLQEKRSVQSLIENSPSL